MGEPGARAIEFEDAREFLELSYFTIALINESITPVQFFKSDFVALITPHVARIVAQNPRAGDRNIIGSPAYRRLCTGLVEKLGPLIDALKQSCLWVPQGGTQSSADQMDMISTVLKSEQPDVDQVLALRLVRVHELAYSPELTLYYNACLVCTQSAVVIVRLYAYALLRSAPLIADVRHMFGVFHFASEIYRNGHVSFEFTAALSLMLSRLSGVGASQVHAEVWDPLSELLRGLTSGMNFNQLVCFDPTLPWLFRRDETSFAQMLDVPLETAGQFLVVARAMLAEGKLERLGEWAAAAVSVLRNWPPVIQAEVRRIVSLIPVSMQATVSAEVVETVAANLDDAVLWVLGPLLVSVMRIDRRVVSKALCHRAVSMSARELIIAIASSANRVLPLLADADFRGALLAAGDPPCTMASVAAARFEVLSEDRGKALVKQFPRPSCEEDRAGGRLCERLLVQLPVAASLYPSVLRAVVERVPASIDSEFNVAAARIYSMASAQGRFDVGAFPATRFVTECSSLAEVRPSRFSERQARLDPDLAQFLVVASASQSAIALLFELSVEEERLLTVFEKIRLKPALWFAQAVTSLFCAIAPGPEADTPIIEFLQGSPANLVWLGVYLWRRLVAGVREVVATETWDGLISALFAPPLGLDVVSAELEAEALSLRTRFAGFLEAIFAALTGHRGPDVAAERSGGSWTEGQRSGDATMGR